MGDIPLIKSLRELCLFLEDTVNISTPEDLIMLKLLSDREQDRLDVKKIFGIQKEHLDIEYIQNWLHKLGIKLKI